jgi:hypothetical protein
MNVTDPLHNQTRHTNPAQRFPSEVFGRFECSVCLHPRCRAGSVR